MKTNLLVIMAVLAAAFTLPTPARAQADAFNVRTVTTSTAAVAANTTGDVTSGTLSVRGSEGIAFVATIKLSGTGTAGVTFLFDVSPDGSTWTTNQPFSSGAIAAAGTASVVAFFNFSPGDSTELRNIQFIRLSKVTNANTPSTLTIESLQTSIYTR